ncbi:hypothetical protein N9X55_05950 [Flavobacteriaceae bacterium]|jgi:hypothetical protein|nr:hypothetical protein [Flavobacteriaceae bacterium]
MTETLTSFLKKLVKEAKNEVLEGVCPNFWRSQEYNHEIRDFYKDKQIDVNNHEANHGFIQKFVVTHIDVIRLKKGNSSSECPKYKAKY